MRRWRSTANPTCRVADWSMDQILAAIDSRQRRFFLLSMCARLRYAVKGRPTVAAFWPHAMSFLFSGGGIAEGQVIGATDGRGEHPVSRRVGVGDFLATIYRRL